MIIRNGGVTDKLDNLIFEFNWEDEPLAESLKLDEMSQCVVYDAYDKLKDKLSAEELLRHLNNFTEQMLGGYEQIVLPQLPEIEVMTKQEARKSLYTYGGIKLKQNALGFYNPNQSVDVYDPFNHFDDDAAEREYYVTLESLPGWGDTFR